MIVIRSSSARSGQRARRSRSAPPGISVSPAAPVRSSAGMGRTRRTTDRSLVQTARRGMSARQGRKAMSCQCVRLGISVTTGHRRLGGRLPVPKAHTTQTPGLGASTHVSTARMGRTAPVLTKQRLRISAQADTTATTRPRLLHRLGKTVRLVHTVPKGPLQSSLAQQVSTATP
jgi:hypothetical protein